MPSLAARLARFQPQPKPPAAILVPGRCRHDSGPLSTSAQLNHSLQPASRPLFVLACPLSQKFRPASAVTATRPSARALGRIRPRQRSTTPNDPPSVVHPCSFSSRRCQLPFFNLHRPQTRARSRGPRRFGAFALTIPAHLSIRNRDCTAVARPCVGCPPPPSHVQIPPPLLPIFCAPAQAPPLCVSH